MTLDIKTKDKTPRVVFIRNQILCKIKIQLFYVMFQN